jgi:DNA-binding winged helix-turn-helix (wHTH) protein
MVAGRLFEFGVFRLDPTERLLFRSDQHVPLPPKALDVLVLLVERRNHVVDKDTLLKELWPDAFVEEGSLAQNISVRCSHVRCLVDFLPRPATQSNDIAK